MAAGACSTARSEPLYLNLHPTCCSLQVYRNMWEAARGIVANRGPAGLYGGLGVTLVEIVPYAALQFGLYDAFNALVNEARLRYSREAAAAAAAADDAAAAAESGKEGGRGGGRHGGDARRRRQRQEEEAAAARAAVGVQESRAQAFACGLLAGLLAKLVSHPLDVAKKRYQVAGLQRSLRCGAKGRRRGWVQLGPVCGCVT